MPAEIVETLLVKSATASEWPAAMECRGGGLAMDFEAEEVTQHSAKYNHLNIFAYMEEQDIRFGVRYKLLLSSWLDQLTFKLLSKLL